MKKKKGISLIVLIITIIVVIILAVTVILTITKNNPIESAKEARFKEDLRTFQDELSLYISKQYTNAGGHWDGNISAKRCDEIVDYIPSFTKKYEGKFIINNNNLEYTNNLDKKEKEYAQSLNVNKNESLLPCEYQQVEYIESTGTQYIDTKMIPNQDTDINIKFKFTFLSDINNSVFGSRASANKDHYGLTVGSRSYHMFYYGYDNHSDMTNEQANIDKYYEIKKEKNLLFINEKKVYESEYNNFTCPGSLYIFAIHEQNYTSFYSKMKLYDMIIGENNNVIRNFIPCYSITPVTDVNGKSCPNGTKGMYDTVEGKFYTNQGTGEDFIAGPEVDE